MKKNKYMSEAIKAVSGKSVQIEKDTSALEIGKPKGQPNTKKFQPQTRLILHRAPRGQNPK